MALSDWLAWGRWALLERSHSLRAPSVSTLEPRVLLSAAPLEAVGVADAAQAADAAPIDAAAVVRELRGEDAAGRELLVLDEALPEANELLRLLEATRAEREVLWVARDETLAEVTGRIAGFGGDAFTAVHVLTHGREGAFDLGAGEVTDESLAENAGLWRSWGGALREGGDLLLYGCDVAAGGDGLLRGLAALTGADVAASTDLTGGAAGADWVLEASAGGVEAAAVSAAGWGHSLGSADFGDRNGSVGYTVDTFIEEGDPSDDMNGSDTVLELDSSPGSIEQGLLRFGGVFASDGGPIPDGAEILSAELRLEVDWSNVSVANQRVHDLYVPFTESTSADDFPSGFVRTDGVEASTVGRVPVVFGGGWKTRFDVTDSVQDWSLGGRGQGFLLRTTTGAMDVNSSESSTQSWRPRLSVTWSDELRIDVTTTADESDGDTSSPLALASAPGGSGVSLREAIAAASGTSLPTTIGFDLGGGSHEIAVSDALGLLEASADDLTIDGRTAAGYAGAPLVTVAGDPSAGGLQDHALRVTGDRVFVTGLAFSEFRSGVLIEGDDARLADNWIGVTAGGVLQTGGDGSGVFVNSSGAEVLDNRISAFSNALDAATTGPIAIRGNDVRDVGTGFRIDGKSQSLDRPDEDGVMNDPVVTSVRRVGGQLQVDVQLHTSAGRTVVLDLLEARHTGNRATGTFVTDATLTADADGRASHTFYVSDTGQTAFSAQATSEGRSSTMAVSRTVPRESRVEIGTRVVADAGVTPSLAGTSRGSASSIVARPGGRWYAVWTASDGSRDVVYGQLINADGTTTEPAVAISDGTADAANAVVGVDAAGRMTVAWSEPDAGDVRFRRVLATGAMNPVRTLDRAGGVRLTQPAIDVAPTGEVVIAATAGEDTPAASRIVARHHQPNGTELRGGVEVLSIPPVSGTARESAVAVSRDAVAVVAHKTDAGLRYSAVDILAGTPAAHFDVFVAGGSKSHDVVAHADGTFELLFLKQDADGHDQIHRQRLDAGGGLVGGVEVLTDLALGDRLDDLSAAASDNGALSLTFYDAAADTVRVLGVGPAGGVGGPAFVAQDAGGGRSSASVAFAPGSDVARVVWQGTDAPGQTPSVYSREYVARKGPADDHVVVYSDRTTDTKADWHDEAFRYRRRISVADIPAGDVADAPVLVRLDSTFDYSLAAAGGSDLLFVAADGTALRHEIARWNASGDSEIWVRASEVRTDGSGYFEMYYGNPLPTAAAPSAVWSGFEGVYHLGGSALADSAVEPPGGAQSLQNDGSTGTAGVVGFARRVEENQSVFANNVDFLDGVSEATVSGWFFAETDKGDGTFFAVGVGDGSDRSRLTAGFKNDEDLFFGAVTGDADSEDLIEVAGAFRRGEWVHVAAAVDYAADRIRVYVDGAEVFDGAAGVSAAATDATASARFEIGDGEFASGPGLDGALDEVRVSHAARSADWVAVEYASMTGGLLSVGEQEGFYDRSVLANDGGDLSLVFNDGFSVGDAQLGSDGHLLYTPTAGFTGVDTVAYKQNGRRAILHVHVVDPPGAHTFSLASPASATTEEGVPLTFAAGTASELSVAATDADSEVTLRISPDGGAVTLASTAGLAGTFGPGTETQEILVTGLAADVNAALDGLTFEDDGDGAVTITLEVTQTDEFGEHHAAAGVVTVDVADVPDLAAGVSHTGGDEAQDITFDAAPTSGGLGPLTYAWDLGGDGSVDGTGETLLLDGGGLNDPDVVTVRLTVTDSRGVSDSVLYDVAVRNVAPTLPDVTRALAVGETFTIDRDEIAALISDPADPLTLTGATLTTGTGRLQVNSQRFRYRPDGEFAGLARGETGTVEIAYHVEEETTYSGRIILTYVAQDHPPEPRDDEATIDEDTAVTLDVLANDSDFDGDAMTASLVGGAAFGTVDLRPDGTLTYTPNADANGLETLTYRVTAFGESRTARVRITVTPVDDRPVVTGGPFTVPENAPAGTTVGGVVVTDIDGPDATFSLLPGPDAAAFTINATTGVLRTSGGPIDFESQSAYALTVRVTSGEFMIDHGVPVTVGDVDEAPTLPPGGFSVDENTSGPLAWLPTASDPEGATLTYSLIDAGGLPLTIDAATGRLTLTAPLDHEAGAVHTVTVGVGDGTQTASRAYDLRVTDVAESPSMSAPAGTVSENAAAGAFVTQLTAADPDAGAALTFAMIDADGGPFSVDATGRVVTTGPLDFESRAAHRLTVSVSDETGRSATRTLSVRVADENEPPAAADRAFVVADRPFAGMPVGRLTAADPDAGDAVAFEITEGGDFFAVDAATGEITIRDDVGDVRTLRGVVSGRYRATDAGGLSVVRSFSADFTAPAVNLTFGDQQFVADEDTPRGTVVGRLSATTDTRDPVAFRALSPGVPFRVDGAELVLSQSLDHETTSEYSLLVEATAGGERRTARVTVRVGDVNEPVETYSGAAAVDTSADVLPGTTAIDLAAELADDLFDPEAAGLAFDLVSASAGLDVTVSEGGLLTFGSDNVAGTLELVVSDGVTAGVAVSVTLSRDASAPPPGGPGASPPTVDSPGRPETPAGAGGPRSGGGGPVLDAGSTQPPADSPTQDSDAGDSDTTETPPAGDAAEIEAGSAVPDPVAGEGPPADLIFAGPAGPAEEGRPSAADAPVADAEGATPEGADGPSAEVVPPASQAAPEDFDSLASFRSEHGGGGGPEAKAGRTLRGLSFAPNRRWVAEGADFEAVRLDLISFEGVTPDSTLKGLDQVRDDLSRPRMVGGAAQQMMLTFAPTATVGYVLWTVRGGFLLTGLLAQIPAWRIIDPLSILEGADGEANDGESLQSMLEESNRTPGGKDGVTA